MYSKEALDLYEQLLEKMASPIRFEKTAIDATSALNKVKDFFTKNRFHVNKPAANAPDEFEKYVSSLSQKLNDEFYRTNSPDLKGLLTRELPQAGPMLQEGGWNSPWMYAAGVGVPSAALAGAYVGKNTADSASEWDKMKYGLGGLGAGLLGPAIYTKLTGKNLLNAFDGENTPPSHLDFTSI